MPEREVYKRNFTPEQIEAKRQYVAEYQRLKRASQRDVKLRRPRDPERRLACEKDPILWLETYCPDRFFNPFTDHQREIVGDLHYTLNNGGDKALADIRGGGKTSMTECYCGGYRTANHERQYGVIISKNSPNAKKVLGSIKTLWESAEGPLYHDYPEICLPVQALEGSASRGRMQTVGGTRTRIIWMGDILQFPLVYPEWCRDCYQEVNPEDPFCPHCGVEWVEEYEDYDDNDNLITRVRPKPSRASLNCIASFGIDAAFVGLKQGSLRPTYAILDDVETEESALSPDQVESKEKTIENSVGGLAGPTSQFSRIMLCTVRGPVSLAAKYTDPQEKPSWRGKRYSQVQAFPENEDYWKEYIYLRKKGQRDGDALALEAAQHYHDNREKMDEGVSVLNPYRFVKADGEVSAIQHVYNKVADRGWSFVIPEYQNQIYINDEESGQLPDRAFLLSKYHPLPSHCSIVYRTGFIDVSKRVLWWMVCSWSRDFSGRITDYGIFPEQRGYEVTRELTETLPGATEDERLLLVKDYAEFLKEKFSLNRIGVDIGWRDDILTPQCDSNMIIACRGQASGVHTKPMHETERRVGDMTRDNWRLRYLQNDTGRYRVLQFDSDFWKSIVHDKLSAAPEEIGTLLLQEPPRDNNELVLHLLSEKRNLVQGRYREFWKYDEPTGHNHWLDCAAGCTVLASTLGLTLSHNYEPKRIPKSWSEMAARQREKYLDKQTEKNRVRKKTQRQRIRTR